MNIADITRLYDTLSPEQQTYFNHKAQIGPFARPRSSGSALWPDRMVIEKDIRKAWGEGSTPMKYYQGIFAPL